MMDRQPTLQGPRLTLRPLRRDDWAELYAVASDPEIWAIHPAHDRWQEPVFRAFFEDAMEQGGALAVMEGGRIIGSSRFQNYDEAASEVEIGWTFLARSHWGGSYNREMKRLMLEHAFRHVDTAVFAIGEGNRRSRRAMEKIGGRLIDRVGERMMAGKLDRHLTYAISRENYAGTALVPERCATMAEVREGVDALDRALAALIGRRFRYMDAAARIKTERAAVRDEARKDEVIRNARANARASGFPEDAAARLWEDLVEASIGYETAVFDRKRT